MINQPNLESNTVSRDFKGIWIPREIWLAKGLLPMEKMLWAEIHSLYDRQRGGCFATNEYLCKFLNVKERHLQSMLANLKARKWLIQVSFDGRTRVLKAVNPPEGFEYKEDSEETEVSAGQGCSTVHPRGAVQCTPAMHYTAPLSYIEGIEEGIVYNTPSTPSSAGAESAAGAAGECVVSPTSPSKKKATKEFPLEVHKVADQLIAVMQKHSQTFRPPAKPVFQEAAALLLQQKQNIANVLKILDWACKDTLIVGDWNGWASMVYSVPSSPNQKYGITKFCLKMDSIEKKMKARKDCKLTPGADTSSFEADMADWRTI